MATGTFHPDGHPRWSALVQAYLLCSAMLMSALCVAEDKISAPVDQSSVAEMPTLTDEEQQWIEEHPVVPYTGDPNWLPFEAFDADGNYIGIVADYLHYIADQTGIEFRKIQAKNWSESLALARSGQVDMISGDAADVVLREGFSPLNISLKNAIVAIMDSRQAPIDDLNEIKDKKIAIIKDYGYTAELKAKYPAIAFIEVENIQQGLHALARGRYDAVLASTTLGSYSIAQMGLYNLKFATVTDVVMEVTFFVANDKSVLKSIVEKTLLRMSPAERAAILNRWIPSRIGDEEKQPRRIELTEEERQWLDAHPSLRFAGDPDWLPYEAFDENGNYIGIVADYLKLIEAMLGIELDIVQTTDWAESVARTRRGEIDVLSETTGSSLKAQMQFTRIYVKTPSVVVMRHDANYVENLSQISDRKIAVISPSGDVTKVREKFSEIDFHEVGNLKEGLIAVSTGEIDALLCSLAHASYGIPRMGLNNIKIVGKTELNTELAFAIQPQLAPLVPLFNRAIAAIGRAEHQRIMESWVTEKYVERVKIDYKLLFLSVIASLLIIGYIYYWNRKLKKNIEVRKRVQAELAVAKQEAESANAAKSQFLATMSHEIRTPMNGVLGMLELLAHTPLDREQKQSVGVIRDSAHSLMTIINDVLDFSKIEANRMEIEEVAAPINQIVEAVVSAQAQVAYDKNLQVRLFIDPALNQELVIDPVRIRQILTNLLSNAIKFTSVGMITVRAECLQQSSDSVRFRIAIEDTGIGIAAADRQNLFTEFSQAEASTTRRFGGSGLGLSICQRLADLMHGTLTLSSEPGSGTIVSYQQTAALSKIEAHKHRELHAQRCLLLTVDEFVRTALMKYLEDQGMEVVIPASFPADVQQLREIVSNRPAKLLLLDEALILQRYLAPNEPIAVLCERLSLPVIALTTEANLSANNYQRDFCSITTNPLQPTCVTRAVSITLGADVTEEQVLSADFIDNPRGGAKILVVEDHPINQQLIAKQLDLLGYACEVHDNGQQGMLAWKSGAFDAIITDCHMPVMDGYAMAQAIRNAEAESVTEPGIPIIALTASAMTGEAGKCLAAGMSDCMSKPVQLETIRRKLNHWVPNKSNESPMTQPVLATERAHSSLNLSYLEDTFNDTEQIKKMLEDYVQSNRKDLRELQGAVGDHNARLAKDTAHRIQGAAKIMAAEKICLHSEQLEELAVAGSWSDLAPSLVQLANAMVNFENDVTMWLEDESELTC